MFGYDETAKFALTGVRNGAYLSSVEVGSSSCAGGGSSSDYPVAANLELYPNQKEEAEEVEVHQVQLHHPSASNQNSNLC